MADVSARTPIFSRGSTVLDYWLAHAEGLTIEPLGARVEEVVVVAPVGRAESLVVRSRVTRRRKTIPAAAIAAVAPSSGQLLLDPPPPRAPRHLPRPSPEHIAAARARAAGTADRTRAGTDAALVWLRPRVARARAAAARYLRLAAVALAAALAWLGPQIAAGARLILEGVVVLARGALWTTRGLERAAVAGVDRGRSSLEARRQPGPRD